jgi:hypothetical protein
MTIEMTPTRSRFRWVSPAERAEIKSLIIKVNHSNGHMSIKRIAIRCARISWDSDHTNWVDFIKCMNDRRPITFQQDSNRIAILRGVLLEELEFSTNPALELF